MRILAEGTLDLPLPEGAKVFTASGILTYNEKSGKLYYFYFGKDKTGRGGKATSKLPDSSYQSLGHESGK